MLIFKRLGCLLLACSVCLSVFVSSVSASTADILITYHNSLSVVGGLGGSFTFAYSDPFWRASSDTGDIYIDLKFDAYNGYYGKNSFGTLNPNKTYKLITQWWLNGSFYNSLEFDTSSLLINDQKSNVYYPLGSVSNISYSHSGASVWFTMETIIPAGTTKISNFTLSGSFNRYVTSLNVGVPTVKLVEIDPNQSLIDNENANHNDNKGFFGGLFDKLGKWLTDMVKNLLDGFLSILMDVFVPSIDFITKFISDLDTFLLEHLGALYYPFHVFVDILEQIIAFTPAVTPSITLPELVVPVGDKSYRLWDSKAYTFDIVATEPFKTIHNLYLVAVDCALSFGLITLLRRKIDEVMRS